jgi:very-short-patch-repair endonuclease
MGEGRAHRFPIPRILKNARILRRTMTDAEKLLWRKLRAEQLGVKFRRQYSIGNYIADFACLDPKIIIELDGGQHNQDKNINYDNDRTRFLELQGFKVLRFWNNEVIKTPENVLESIFAEIKFYSSSLEWRV